MYEHSYIFIIFIDVHFCLNSIKFTSLKKKKKKRNPILTRGYLNCLLFLGFWVMDTLRIHERKAKIYLQYKLEKENIYIHTDEG